MAHDPKLAGELIMMLFHSRTSAHVAHLQTRSYAQHKALNDYYDEIVDLADELAESYQGAHAVLLDMNEPYSPSPDFQTELKGLRAWIVKHRAAITGERELQNMVDNVLGLIDGTLYKLKFLS